MSDDHENLTGGTSPVTIVLLHNNYIIFFVYNIYKIIIAVAVVGELALVRNTLPIGRTESCKI